MSRVVFEKGKQKIWISNILSRNVGKIGIGDLAHLCGVSQRTIRDWRREKFTISLAALTLLSKTYNQAVPRDIKTVDDYWYCLKGARNGGLAHVKLYGPPGSHEDRIKGGLISQKRRRENPEQYQNCLLPKSFDQPQRNEELAELIGIILGDGGITHDQLRITLNKKTEENYANFVSNLIESVFKEKPTRHFHQNVCVLTITGVNLISLLGDLGIFARNKVAQQAGVPGWIVEKPDLAAASLRGLIDTDGCVYSHLHLVGGKYYRNFGLCFTNHSKPLLNFVHTVLLNRGFSAKLKPGSNVFLYRADEMIKYMETIGTNNAHHKDRLEDFINIKRKGAGVV